MMQALMLLTIGLQTGWYNSIAVFVASLTPTPAPPDPVE